MACPSFLGYRRFDNKVGIRNEIWIIPAVGCVNNIAKTLVAQNQDLVTGSIDGLYAFPHPFGCSQTGSDHAQTRKLLAALARHPICRCGGRRLAYTGGICQGADDSGAFRRLRRKGQDGDQRLPRDLLFKDGVVL